MTIAALFSDKVSAEPEVSELGGVWGNMAKGGRHICYMSSTPSSRRKSTGWLQLKYTIRKNAISSTTLKITALVPCITENMA